MKESVEKSVVRLWEAIVTGIVLDLFLLFFLSACTGTVGALIWVGPGWTRVDVMDEDGCILDLRWVWGLFMKVNLTRRFFVPLSSEACLKALKDAIGGTHKHFFEFPLFGKHHLKIQTSTRFKVSQAFGRGPVLEGFIEPADEQSCRIYIRLMPPLWLLLAFALLPLYFFAFLTIEANEWILFGVWFCLWIAVIAAIWLCSLKLFHGLDKVLGTLNAEPVFAPFSKTVFLRKAGLYLLVVIVYVGVLFLMGYILSYGEN